MNILDFIKDYYLYLIAGLVIIIVLAVLITLILKKKKKKKLLVEKKELHSQLIDGFGGVENVISSEAKGSRLNLVLKDYTKLNEERIKELGVSSIIKMSTKVTLIIGTQAKEISDSINKK